MASAFSDPVRLAIYGVLELLDSLPGPPGIPERLDEPHLLHFRDKLAIWQIGAALSALALHPTILLEFTRQINSSENVSWFSEVEQACKSITLMITEDRNQLTWSRLWLEEVGVQETNPAILVLFSLYWSDLVITFHKAIVSLTAMEMFEFVKNWHQIDWARARVPADSLVYFDEKVSMWRCAIAFYLLMDRPEILKAFEPLVLSSDQDLALLEQLKQAMADLVALEKCRNQAATWSANWLREIGIEASDLGFLTRFGEYWLDMLANGHRLVMSMT